MRRTVTVKARCGGGIATVIVNVYRRTAWLSVEPSCNSEAILDPAHVDTLVNTLIQAVQEAREYQP